MLPLLRAALAAGDFPLVRKLLHFFWAFFRCRGPTPSSSNPNSNGQLQLQQQLLQHQEQQHSTGPAAAGEAQQQSPLQLQQQQKQQQQQQLRLERKSQQREQLRSLLWRPLQQELQLDAAAAAETPRNGSAAAAAVAAAAGEPWLSRVPVELPPGDRLLAARVYQDVEAAVAAAAATLVQQQQWLRLFDLATTLALDLPAWLRSCSSHYFLLPVAQPQQKRQQQQQLGEDATAAEETTEEPTAAAAAAAAAPAAFFAAVSSFLEQLPVGDTAVSLRLQWRLVPGLRRLQQHAHQEQLPGDKPKPKMSSPISAAAAAAAAGNVYPSQMRKTTSPQLSLLCNSGYKQQEAAAEIARYLANVMLLAGMPVYTLALAAAVGDSKSASQVLRWYPCLCGCFMTAATDAPPTPDPYFLKPDEEAALRQWLARAATEG